VNRTQILLKEVEIKAQGWGKGAMYSEAMGIFPDAATQKSTHFSEIYIVAGV
jgi:hypothetical protein